MDRNGKQMAKEMSNFVNCFGNSHQKEFVKQMILEHNTLQQSFTRLCIMWFQQLAETKYYDARNEASVELAKQLKPILDEYGHLPCI